MLELIQTTNNPAKLLAIFRAEEIPDATFCDPLPSAPRINEKQKPQ